MKNVALIVVCLAISACASSSVMDEGIAARKAIMAIELAALEAGATPRYDDAGNYIGHTLPGEKVSGEGSYKIAMCDQTAPTAQGRRKLDICN